MRVAYVGNFTRAWCTEVHVAASLEELGHKVFRLQENSVNWGQLPLLCGRRRVDLLLWTRTWGTDMRAGRTAICQLRDRGIPSVSFHLDRFHGLEREPLIEQEPFFTTDLLVTPDDGPWASYGVRHRWLPPGVFDRETGQVPPNPDRWPWDVVFVGSHPYPHPEWEPVRTALIETFRREFGDRFAVLPAEWTHRRPLRGRELQELYATVPVVVGDSCLVGAPYRYWSDRIPETLGRGPLLVHPEVAGMEEWYRHGEELLTYTAGWPEGAVNAVRWALDNEHRRREIADQGRALVLSRDTYRDRMRTVLEWIAAGVHLEPIAPVVSGVATPAGWTQLEGGSLELFVDQFEPRATFELVDGLGDLAAVGEVWRRDYPITPEMVEGKIVVDIGANIGAFSVLAALLGARKVLAFEPDPENYAVLCRNLKLNGVERVVYPVRAAVVGHSGGDVALAGHATACHVTRLGETVEWWATAVGADDAIPTDAYVVKLDCEGGEYEILDALTHWPAFIFMEWHAGPTIDPASWSTMVTQLAEQGRVSTVGTPSRGGLLSWSRY